MKRFSCLTAVVLVLCLCAVSFLPAAAEAPNQGAIFFGMLDRIAYALPAGGCLLVEAEFPGMMEDVRQIYGFSSGGEFTLRTAKIGGWIEKMLAEYPDEDPYHVRANTLLQFATMIISSFDGEPTDLRAHDGGEYVSAAFSFTYPDTPGVTYEGAAVLNVDTGRAVTFYGESGDMTDAAIVSLRYADESEAAEFAATRVPATEDFGEFTADFPVQTLTVGSGSGRVVGCMTDGFDYLAVQVFPGMSVQVSGSDEIAKADLLVAAKRVITPTIGDAEITESELTHPAPGVTMLTILCPDPFFGQSFYRCALIVGRENVFYVWSTDTEAGRAFLDSFAWKSADLSD